MLAVGSRVMQLVVLSWDCFRDDWRGGKDVQDWPGLLEFVSGSSLPEASLSPGIYASVSVEVLPEPMDQVITAICCEVGEMQAYM